MSLEVIKKALSERILVLDGAMGTMIQLRKLQEEDYRGERFARINQDVKGNNDLLCLTQPELIREIHGDFLAAGADIIETNSFNATSISMADYSMEPLVTEINVAAAKIARSVADEWTQKTPNKPRYVAGSIGPTSKTLSISPDVNNPGYREVTFDEVRDSYKEQVRGLIEGGVDLILIETIFDTLNSKACIIAVEEVFDECGIKLPIMLSCTVTDMSGRNLSGQTIEAFWYSVRHARPLTVGMNCAFGAEHLRPHAVALSAVAETNVCIYPNAGLPNEMGEYDETAEEMASQIKEWAEEGLLNVVGGCCGTRPDHIKAISEAVAGVAPRKIPQDNHTMRLAGLEPLVIVNT